MQNAETILSIIRTRGERGLPLKNIYRMLFNRNLYLKAYAKLYPNDGAMTEGTTKETADGMSLAKIDAIIEALRYERYRWTPVKRIYIPKKNGKQRPLGMPTWSDKLVQEVIRSLLQEYYELQFSQHSHGFRPERGCHTALQEIQQKWTGTRWFIEGDISKYFDTIDHNILLTILEESIDDKRFLRLIKGLLQAGYLEEWKLHPTLSGTPQGGVISPLLSNIYLDKFDQYIQKELLPAYTKGEKRAESKLYNATKQKALRWEKLGRTKEAKELRKKLKTLPSKDPKQTDYRRLRYVRYADDFLLGFAGPRQEAEEIKRTLGTWLQEHLKLTLSEQKTLITHASTQAARFLGYEIKNQQGNDQRDSKGKRSVNGTIGLQVPKDVVEAKCAQYSQNGKPKRRPERMHDSDYAIVMQYQQEYRGIVQYYLLAYDVRKLGKLHYIMKSSLLQTLANKHHARVNALVAKYQAKVPAPGGALLMCLQVRVEREGKKPLIAQFGGIPLKRQQWAVLDDQPFIQKWSSRSEILQRLLANICELCGSTQHVEVHHIRKLADLKRYSSKDKPEWVKAMIARQRKTLMVCRNCHHDIHAGRLQK